MSVISSVHINIKKVVFFVALFIAGVIFFESQEGNVGVSQTRRASAEPSFPLVRFYEDDTRVNLCYGYAYPMEVTSMRDTITPVGEDMLVDFEVDAEGLKVEGLSYEVRTTDGERFIENGECEYTETDGAIRGSLSLQNLLADDTEYMLCIIVSVKEQDIYYYTRIKLKNESTVDEALEFAISFHNTTMSGTGGSSIATYVEPDPTKDNSSLAEVDITSSLTQIMWADFEPQEVTELVVDICEMQDIYQSFTLRQRVKSGASDDEAVYDVEEYFRVRVGEERVYLLEYERTANRVFDAGNLSFAKTYINLGIRESDVDIVSNATGTKAAFVQEGELWLYDQDNDKLADIFGFAGGTDGDERNMYQAHDIKILSMDEAGTIEFAVYGYMAAGDHEGQVGVGLYRYDSSEDAVTEETFVSGDKSYQQILAETGDLFYVNAANVFYLIYDDSLYGIDMNTQTYEVVASGLKNGKYAVSKSNSALAWVDDSDNAADLTVLDLDTLKESTVEASGGSYIRPLAYLGEDLLCGEAAMTDIITDKGGHVTFPMSTLTIYDEELSEIKTYNERECFVVDVYEKDGVVHLERITINGSEVSEYMEDTIIDYSSVSDGSAVSQEDYTDSVLQTQVRLVMSGKVNEPSVVQVSEIITQNPEVTVFTGDFARTMYYIYRNERIEYDYTVASEAVTVADGIRGVVVSSGGGLVWTADLGTKTHIEGIEVPVSSGAAGNIAKCIDAILYKEGISESAQDALANNASIYETMKSLLLDYQVVDLCGCTTDEVLYYVDNGFPVLAVTGDNDAVLIVGFDEYNTLLFYPEENEWGYYGMNDSRELFAETENVFYGYIK